MANEQLIVDLILSPDRPSLNEIEKKLKETILKSFQTAATPGAKAVGDEIKTVLKASIAETLQLSFSPKEIAELMKKGFELSDIAKLLNKGFQKAEIQKYIKEGFDPSTIAQLIEKGFSKASIPSLLGKKGINHEKIGGRIGGVLEHVGKIGGGLGGGLFGAISSTGQTALGAAGPYGAAAAAGIGAIQNIFKGLHSAAATANPAYVKQFDRALQDITGVIGHAVAPVFRALTPWVRLFGDLLKGILPSQKEVNNLFKSLTPVLNEVRTAFAAIAPLIKSEASGLTKQFTELTKEYALLLTSFLGLTKGTLVIVTTLARLGANFYRPGKWLSILKEGFEALNNTPTKLPDSTGQAYRGAPNYTGVGEYGKGVALSAFGSTSGTYQRRSAEAAEQTVRELRQLTIYWREHGHAPGFNPVG